MKNSSKRLKQRLTRYEPLFQISRKLTPEERVRRLFAFYDFIKKMQKGIVKYKDK
jgi:hypothetical protein